MATVIFVHGTGGRKDNYVNTFEIIEKRLKQLKPTIQLVPCLWGESLGTKLNADGASIPNYSENREKAQSKTEEDDSIQLWQNLYQDPIYEVKLLRFRPIHGANTFARKQKSQQLNTRLEQLAASTGIVTQLQEVGVTTEIFSQAVGNIRTSELYKNLLETVLDPFDETCTALARAIIAQVIVSYPQSTFTEIRYDANLRNRIVDLITSELSQGTQDKGVVGNFVKSQFLKRLFNIGDWYLRRKRGSLTDAAYPFAGDILFYQAKGKQIRDFIGQTVNNYESPVILLTHSLGGIASVELLAEQDLPQVKLLITVGSQAPFLYEINALQTLSYGQPLPAHFPKWLNIYDLRDILSYVGDRPGLFPQRIKDVEVDNQQPFPESHGAYWFNSQTWNAILEEMG